MLLNKSSSEGVSSVSNLYRQIDKIFFLFFLIFVLLENNKLVTGVVTGKSNAYLYLFISYPGYLRVWKSPLAKTSAELPYRAGSRKHFKSGSLFTPSQHTGNASNYSNIPCDYLTITDIPPNLQLHKQKSKLQSKLCFLQFHAHTPHAR